MIELNGRYGSAKVFSNNVDQASIAQIIELLNQEFTQGSKIRMMPDVHAGAGCTIGTTMTITDKIVPNLVGVDIGCGMETCKLSVRVEKGDIATLKKLDKTIRARIPSGFSIHYEPHHMRGYVALDDLICADAVDLERATRSIGTLGGGNHFIELANDDEATYLIIHSGSRHLGLEVAKHYQNLAYESLNKSSANEIAELVRQYKAAGKERQIDAAIKALKNTKRTSVPRDLAYLEGKLKDDYIHDMRIVQKFALLNRVAMTQTILNGMGWDHDGSFSTIHNYIDTEAMILRKGAVSATEGERLLIPMNMRDGSLICRGRGNPDWNFSAPHGAGRIMSRAEAKRSLTVDEFVREMASVWSTSVGRDTLDEAPMAYKPMQEIVDNISPTVEILTTIKPIYNFKASGD